MMHNVPLYFKRETRFTKIYKIEDESTLCGPTGNFYFFSNDGQLRIPGGFDCIMAVRV